jgi:branched-chain amino acid transport system permease protein
MAASGRSAPNLLRDHLSGARWLIPTAGVVLAVLPLFTQDPYVIHIINLSLIFAILSMSWNLLVGYAGIFSFGHQAFFGLGGYTSSLLAMRLGISPWLAMPIGALAAALLSLIIAVPSLRLRGAAYVAIATLGFAEVTRIVAQNLVDLTKGEMGLWGIPPLFASQNRVLFYYTALILFAVTAYVIYRIVRSPFGLALKAIRESPAAADSLGVDVVRVKILVFLVSSFFAGLVGAFYAHYLLILTPTAVLSVEITVQAVAMTLIGGLGTQLGPILGAFAFTIALESMRFLGDYRMLLFGAVLVVLMFVTPEGVVKRILPRNLTE